MWFVSAPGRIGPKVEELKVWMAGRGEQKRAEELARQLDADEVGRRADRRRLERESPDGPPTVRRQRVSP